jgi:hypothetical protein
MTAVICSLVRAPRRYAKADAQSASDLREQSEEKPPRYRIEMNVSSRPIHRSRHATSVSIQGV